MLSFTEKGVRGVWHKSDKDVDSFLSLISVSDCFPFHFVFRKFSACKLTSQLFFYLS